MTKPRRYGGKSHPAMPTQEQTRPMTTETSNLYKKYSKNTLFLMSPPKTSLEKKKRCKLMTKPRRYCGKSHPGTPTQEQTRPITTETSNLVEKSTLWFSCKDEHWKKKRCKLMTKPRRYGEKSHPATPTQEQTRPISTETSNLVEKSTLFVIFPAKTSVEKTNVASWWQNRAGMVENLIPQRQLRSKRDQYRRKLAI